VIKGLILDMDGTTLNSFPLHLEAWKLLLKKYKILKEESEILSHFGKTTETIAKELFPEEYDPERMAAEKDDIFFTLIPKLRPFKGVSELLIRLKQQKYLTCLASSNPSKTIKAIISHLGLKIDTCVGIDDIQRGKPAPDMILIAADRLHLPISECLVVGDSPYDIQAAKAAKCKVVAVLTGTHNYETLQKEKPDFILSSIVQIEDILTNE
jgi:HAD superfamily hydrolase (TIGR01509 family)